MEGRMTRLLVSREILRVSVGESGSIFQTAPKPLPDRSGSGSGAVWERFGSGLEISDLEGLRSPRDTIECATWSLHVCGAVAALNPS